MAMKLYEQVLINEAEKVNQLVFNSFSVRVFRLTSTSSHDTDYIYDLYTDSKLNKSNTEAVKHFISGVISTLRSF